jgi:mannose-6-phosphate isomerase-like protein (cupin superfamily)
MKGFIADIEELCEGNSNFRQVLYTGQNLQLVIMTLKPGEEIGEEVHEYRDQFFRVEKGIGEAWIDGKRSIVEQDEAILVPAGTRHNIVNTGARPLRLCIVYGPPEHREGTIHRTKADADRQDEHFDGQTSEVE